MKMLRIEIDDWLSSPLIQNMDALEERGYLRMLLNAARQEDCGLTSDDTTLAVISLLGSQWNKPSRDKSKRTNLTSGQKLRACFVERNQRLYDDELVEHCNAEKKLKEARRRAGQIGNQRRWGTDNKSSERVADRSQLRSQSEETPVARSEHRALAPDEALYSRYEEFLQKWPADRRGVDLGAQMWISLVDSGEITDANIESIFDGLERWKASEAWQKDNGKFIPAIASPHGTGWLQKRSWKDYPKPATEEF